MEMKTCFGFNSKSISKHYRLPARLLFLISIAFVLGLGLQSCKGEIDAADNQTHSNEKINVRSYSVDTVYVEGSGFTTSSPNPSSIIITPPGNWRWIDNNGATNWTNYTAPHKIHVTCTCLSLSGNCQVETSDFYKYTCDRQHGCDNCEMDVDITDAQNNTVAHINNGITIRF